MRSDRIRLLYSVYVGSVALFVPLKVITHPDTFGGGDATVADYLISAAATMLLGVWVVGFALSFIVLSGRAGQRKIQLFWMLVVCVCLVAFAAFTYRDLAAAVAMS